MKYVWQATAVYQTTTEEEIALRPAIRQGVFPFIEENLEDNYIPSDGDPRCLRQSLVPTLYIISTPYVNNFDVYCVMVWKPRHLVPTPYLLKLKIKPVLQPNKMASQDFLRDQFEWRDLN